ncbi:MAG: hypothetical protein H0T89_16505 [Deltaproteobacteria bacterium]|nr:hypothetical protein [Deltaproteobacteria bacterium]MDQ3299438.1 hypothetical protein [Myxococcota bacterium]
MVTRPRTWSISFGALVTLVVGVLSAVALAAPPIPVTARKFDHDRHVSAARASGKQAACADCHRYDASGTMRGGKEHERCAACHTYPSSCSTLKQGGPKGPARVCEICHVAKRRECLPTDLPPPPKTDSFMARFTHGKHLTLGQSIEKDCAHCHRAQAAGGGTADAPKVAAHKLCAGCHNPNGAKPTMAECATCHVEPTARTSTGSTDPFRLASFDHKAHHGASRQASCLGCHDKLVGAGESALPRPSMMGCQNKCHDGDKAFSAVGTKCTQCHRGSGPAASTRPDVTFLHEAHATRGVKIASCGTCHTLEADGRLLSPLARKEHQPCAASGCHQSEFASRATKICGVCHDAVAPWQKNTARSRSPESPEWFETIDHASHLAKMGTANGACTSCHGEKLVAGPKPGGHDGCAGCHGKGTSPAMTQCAACHSSTPAARRTASPWSVAAKFSHPTHATDARTKKTTPCLDCHASVKTAKTLATIKPPTMAACDNACHNGKVAFKTTGFDCARCHAPPKVSAGAPTAMLDEPMFDAEVGR